MNTYNKMSWPQLLLLFAFTALAIAERSFAEFQVRKKHTSGDKFATLGKLTVNIHLPEHAVEAYLDTHLQELINQEDFKGGHQAILEFICVDSDLPDYKDRVYMTSVDEISSEPHGQKISIILGPLSEGVQINSINYVQTRERVGEIYTEIVNTEPAYQQIFKYQYAPKKSEAENESFWSKYKWPLIIGGVVIYTMMNSGGAAGQQQGQGGAGR